MAGIDHVFAGSIPEFYDRYLVPMLFEPYAADLAGRLVHRQLHSVLEVAAGTGVVTRQLAALLPREVVIVATDLNPAMLKCAASYNYESPIDWRQADALALPFPDATFDAVVCQFGAMFFPDKSKAFSEALRVLRTGGVFLFNVWDRISENAFADTVTAALQDVFPQDPPRFLVRTPHGYHDLAALRFDLAAAASEAPHIETLALKSEAATPHIPAIAYCQGTPLRSEIEVRDATRLEEATDAAAHAIAERFGLVRIAGKMQAHVIWVEKG